MDDRELVNKMERLRGQRVWVRDDSIAGLVGDVLGSVRKLSRAESAAADAWRAVVPEEFAETTVFVSLRRGVLVVRATDAGVRHRADRWLRSGGELLVVEAARTGVKRVRMV